MYTLLRVGNSLFHMCHSYKKKSNESESPLLLFTKRATRANHFCHSLQKEQQEQQEQIARIALYKKNTICKLLLLLYTKRVKRAFPPFVKKRAIRTKNQRANSQSWLCVTQLGMTRFWRKARIKDLLLALASLPCGTLSTVDLELCKTVLAS